MMRKSRKTIELIWRVENVADAVRRAGYDDEADEIFHIARKLGTKAEYEAREEAVRKVRSMVQLNLF